MNRQFLKNRRARYGGLAILVTLLVLAAILLANTLVGTLAARYGWQADLRQSATFSIGEHSAALVRSALDAAGEGAKVQIHFCDEAEPLQAGEMTSYLQTTAKEFAALDSRIELVYHNVVLDPQSVEAYRTATVIDPETGTEVTRTVNLQTSAVIIAAGDYHRAYTASEFFLWEDGSSTPTAYQGEKKFASGILRALAPVSPVVCLTNNHGETYYDYEILYLLDDAGYRLDYIDLTQSPIPEECSLLVCFNPNNDLAEKNGVAAVSESELLDQFLSVPGHALLVFLENRTPNLPNLDAYLATWGIQPCYAKGESADYRYMIREELASLTSDGYTIPGTATNAELAKQLTDGISHAPVFSNATGFVAAQGFVPNAQGGFEKGNRQVAMAYRGGSGAVAYANGKAVDTGDVGLLALGEQTLSGGSSHIVVVSSVNFATEELMRSGAYGNSDLLLRVASLISGIPNGEGIGAAPFPSTVMHGLSRGQRIGWTLALTLIPAAIIAAVAVPVLVRRKHS